MWPSPSGWGILLYLTSKLETSPQHWYPKSVTHRLPRHHLLLATVTFLTSCATTRDAIDDEALYRAQDKTFRPMGN